MLHGAQDMVARTWWPRHGGQDMVARTWWPGHGDILLNVEWIKFLSQGPCTNVNVLGNIPGANLAFHIYCSTVLGQRTIHCYLPPEGVVRYCFHPVCLCVSVCLSVCVSAYMCVRPIFWYFISCLIEEISI